MPTGMRRELRTRRGTAVTGLALAAGLTVAGCSSASSGSSSAAASATTASVTATPASSAPMTSASAVPATSSAGPAASPSPSLSGSAAAAGICQPAHLRLRLGAARGGDGQQTMAVVLVNAGSSACAMTGFPGVDLVGAASGKQDYRWSLTRSSAHYATVTVEPGQAAHFDLTYLPGVTGDGTNLTVRTIFITPPNAFTQAQVTWHQSVLLQDGATHPGTYISPVAAGS
jgi:hypothetical protein